MIKTVFAVLFSFLVCFQAAFAVVTRKKFSSGKQQYYIYYDGNGQEIAREKTVKNQPSVFSPGADINGEVRELGLKGEPATAPQRRATGSFEEGAALRAAGGIA